MDMRGSRKDLLAGAVFVGFGLAFAVTASTYEIGSAVRMGPGYFPLVLGGLLVLLGILIAGSGLTGGGTAGDTVGGIAGDTVGDTASVSDSAGDTVSVSDSAGDEFGPVPWKAAVLLVGALLFFGFTVRRLGLAPAVFVTVFLAAMAGRDARPVPAAMVAGSLTALSIIVFVSVLQLRLPLVGPWLGG